MKRWAIFVVVIFVIALIGNWTWKELSPYQSGPLADVTWKPNGRPYVIHVHMEDEQGRPLAATLVTVFTDEGDHDYTTNIDGETTINCSGHVLIGIKVNHRTVFSKSLARLSGSPSVVDGIDVKIIAKRSDLLGLGPQNYDYRKYVEESRKALQKTEQELKSDDTSAGDVEATPPNENDAKESTPPNSDGDVESTPPDEDGEQ